METDPARSPIILIVEDETLVRMATAEHLRDAGYTVIEAANGDEAQAVLEAGVQVSLIFSDVNMPGALDGLALAEWAGAQQDPPVVMLTSGVPAMLAQARSTCPSVRAILTKPYTYEDLERAVRELLPRTDGPA
ncbi:MAG: response regulator [Vitreimonas sp.]